MRGLIGGFIFLSGSALAQLISPAPESPNLTFIHDPKTYGTQDETIYTIHASAFSVDSSILTWGSGGAGQNRVIGNGGGCCASAPVALPAGASIIGYSVEGCDGSTTGSLGGILNRCLSPADPNCFPVGPYITTGVANVPGCAFFRVDLSTPATVNNVSNTYYFRFDNTGDVSGNVYLRAARIYYRLQVSPAPPTPTFADVPSSHPFYQFIEALADAGITAGCTAPPNPNYCPNDFLTRGQMAVFLARALGLHWAP